MKKTICSKKLLFAICFLVCLSVMCGGLTQIFRYKETGGGGGFANFYDEEKNNMDVMFFGSSHAHCTYNTAQLWEENGIASYILSAGAQPMDGTYYYMKEAFRRQSPRVVFVETYLFDRFLYNEEAQELDTTALYRTDLNMRWSPSYCGMVLEQRKSCHLETEEFLELLLQLPIVHARYNELERRDFYNRTYFCRGYRGNEDIVEQEVPAYSDAVRELSPEGKRFMKRMADLAAKNHATLVFVHSPYGTNEAESMMQNGIRQYAEEIGSRFIDFNDLYEELGLNPETDWRDPGHLNNTGAHKVTSYIAKMLEEEYDIPHHKGDPKYGNWDRDVRYFASYSLRNALENSGDLPQYLRTLAGVSGEYSCIIGLTGAYDALGPVYLEELCALGITPEQYTQGGMFLLDRGNVRHYAGELRNEEEISLGRRMVSAVGGGDTPVSFIMDGLEYANVENGVYVLVYDPELDVLVDAITVNVYLGLDVCREEGRSEL